MGVLADAQCGAGTYGATTALSSVRRYPPVPTTGSYAWTGGVAVNNALTVSGSNTADSYGFGTYSVSSSSAINVGGGGPGSTFNYATNDAYTSLWYPDYTNTYDGSSGAYIGSKTLGGRSGEWIYINLPVPIVLTSYVFNAWTASPLRAPQKWFVLGSNDGVTWTLLDSQDYSTTNIPYATTPTYSSNALVATTTYSYLALVVGAVGKLNGVTNGLNFQEWQLNGREFFGGATVCTNCVAGTYSTALGATSSATCVGCAAGTYKAAYAPALRRLDRSCGTSGTDACAVSSSSNYLGDYPASKAIDGDITTFMHTSLTDANPWLQLDFGVTREVRGGTLWNRQECCPERLDGAKIWVGNSATYNGAGNQNCFTVPAGGLLSIPFTCTAVGRYFFVQGTTVASGLSYPVLGIGEVQVLGSTAAIQRLDNACGAAGTSVCDTLQSTTLSGYPASNALDGNTGTFTHTFNDASFGGVDLNPWWRLDLGTVRDVRGGILWNRVNCCQTRLNGAKIWVGNSPTYNGLENQNCFTVPTGGVASTTFTCTVTGRYFFVQQLNIITSGAQADGAGDTQPVLSIAELQVWGSTTVNTCTVCPPNTSSAAAAARCTANAGFVGPTIHLPFLADLGNEGTQAAVAAPVVVGSSPVVQTNVCDSASTCRTAAYFPNAGDATATAYLKVPNAYAAPMTVSYWAKTTSTYGVNQCALALDDGNSIAGGTSHLGWNAADSPGGLYLYAMLGSWGCGASGYTGTAKAANLWHHVTYTISSSYVLTGYVNGVVYNTAAACSANMPAYTNFVVGSCTGVSYGIQGWLADVRLYQFALSSTQVAAIYASNGTALAVQCTGSCSASQTLHCNAAGTAVCCGAEQSYADGETTGTTCSSCAAGSYSAAGTCTTCPAGSYCPNTGMSVATSCPAGTYSTALGAITCTTCGAGTYSTGGGSSVCLTCPAGNYCPTTGLSAYTPCQTCGTGSYQSTLCPQGSTADVSRCVCNPGYYTVGVSTVANPIPCSECPAGTYSPTVNATSYPCTQCPPGTYSSLTARTNSLACVPCLPGSFGPTPGSIEGPPQ